MRWAVRLERREELFVLVVAKATGIRKSQHSLTALRRGIRFRRSRLTAPRDLAQRLRQVVGKWRHGHHLSAPAQRAAVHAAASYSCTAVL